MLTRAQRFKRNTSVNPRVGPATYVISDRRINKGSAAPFNNSDVRDPRVPTNFLLGPATYTPKYPGPKGTGGSSLKFKAPRFPQRKDDGIPASPMPEPLIKSFPKPLYFENVIKGPPLRHETPCTPSILPCSSHINYRDGNTGLIKYKPFEDKEDFEEVPIPEQRCSTSDKYKGPCWHKWTSSRVHTIDKNPGVGTYDIIMTGKCPSEMEESFIEVRKQKLAEMKLRRFPEDVIRGSILKPKFQMKKVHIRR